MIYLILASVIWSFSFGLIKTQLVGINPFLVAFMRVLLALLCFLPLVHLRQINKSFCLRLMGLGAIQYGFMFIPYILAYRYLEAYQIALLSVTTPLYVIIIDNIRQKSLTFRPIAYACVSILGAAIVLYQEKEIPLILTGFFLVEIANLCFAFGQISYRQLRVQIKMSASESFAWILMGASLVTGLVCLRGANIFQVLTISLYQWLTLAYLGIISTGLAFFLWNKGSVLTSIPVLSVTNNLKIFLTTGISFLVFKEKIRWGQFICGGSLILLSIYWSHRMNESEA